MKVQSDKETGVGLIAFMGALIIMGLLAAAVISILGTGALESTDEQSWNQAYYAAESGLSVARATLSTNAAWYTNLPLTLTGQLGQATFTAVISSNPAFTNLAFPMPRVTSSGACNAARWTTIWNSSEQMRAMIVYRQAADFLPRYRLYSSLNHVNAETNALTAGSNPQWQRVVADPVNNEFLLLLQNALGQVWAQAYTNGAWGSRMQMNTDGTVPAQADRGFDVAYENVRGRGMAVYSVGAATPRYRTWDGTNWSAEGVINVGASDPIRWIRLRARPGTNDIMLLSRWQSSSLGTMYGSAIRWNGSVWTNLVTLENNNSSQVDREPMDVAWSTNSALVLYVNGNNKQPRYRTYTTSAGWSAESTMTALNNMAQWVRVEYNRDGTQAYACFVYGSGNKNYIRGAYWNGAAWGAYNTFNNDQLEMRTTRDFDIAWSTKTNVLMMTYAGKNDVSHTYMVQTNQGAAASGLMAPSADGVWSVLRADPFTGNFLYASIDTLNDVNVQRWSGTNWVLVREVTVASDVSYNSVDIAFREDIAPR